MPFDGGFHFDIDVDVFEKAGEDPSRARRIGGYVTTEDVDQQGEKILQSGLDFSHFLSKGWFNDNHSKDTAGIVGYPEIAERRQRDGKAAWYVEGHLLKGTERADRIWELANALQKSGRRLGYSVEGKIQERRGKGGKIIAKAIVKNVAITNCPVNEKTSLEVLAKSLGVIEAALANADDPLGKALAMGPAQVGGPAPGDPVVPGRGAVLVPESITGYTPGGRKKKKRKKGTTRLNPASADGGLSKAEGIAFLRGRCPHLSFTQAARIYAVASIRALAHGGA